MADAVRIIAKVTLAPNGGVPLTVSAAASGSFVLGNVGSLVSQILQISGGNTKTLVQLYSVGYAAFFMDPADTSGSTCSITYPSLDGGSTSFAAQFSAKCPYITYAPSSNVFTVTNLGSTLCFVRAFTWSN